MLAVVIVMHELCLCLNRPTVVKDELTNGDLPAMPRRTKADTFKT